MRGRISLSALPEAARSAHKRLILFGLLSLRTFRRRRFVCHFFHSARSVVVSGVSEGEFTTCPARKTAAAPALPPLAPTICGRAGSKFCNTWRLCFSARACSSGRASSCRLQVQRIQRREFAVELAQEVEHFLFHAVDCNVVPLEPAREQAQAFGQARVEGCEQGALAA